MIPLRLTGIGKAVPSQVVTSRELDATLGHPTGYVFEKSGVRERFMARPGENQAQLAALALRDALANAGLKAASVDLLISACGVPQQALPNTAVFIALHAGLPDGTPAFDVNASCLGFMAALQVAAGLLATGSYRRIAVVASDLASRGVDWSDAESSLIFGDGAAAVIVEAGDTGQGIVGYRMETYPAGRAHCEIRGGGTERNPRAGSDPADYLFRMEGKAVFKLASKVMPPFLDKLMATCDGGLGAVDVVVPHQASALALKHVARLLDVPDDKIVRIYETHGNQVAASIPCALHAAIMSGRARPGSRVMLIGTAAGLSIGAMVLDL